MLSEGAAVFIQTNRNNPLLTTLAGTFKEELSLSEEGEKSESDVKNLIKYSKKIQADWIVLDGYEFDEAYEKSILESGVKLFRIDDIPSHVFQCHVFLSQNFGAENINFATSENSKKALGLNYLILSKKLRDFKYNKRVITDSVSLKLLITLGGAANLTARAYSLIAEALSKFNSHKVEITMIAAGLSAPDKESLDRILSGSGHQYKIHDYVNDLENYMVASDFVITSVGTTMWELVYLGVPFAVIPLTNPQEEYAKTLVENKICLTFPMVNILQMKDIIKFIHNLFLNLRSREELISVYDQILDRKQLVSNLKNLFY
jgi:UDP-2,4-diacetamido-2,4,6-trideoxy-beta-L-altropyranose hydrolase